MPPAISSRTRPRRARWALPAVLAAPLAALAGAGLIPAPTAAAATTSPTGATAAAPTPAVRVVGDQLVDASGTPVRLLGVDRSGTEYACVQGWGIFDGPADSASVAAIASWHVNAVRVPLNEDCWLGINGVSGAYSGANYQQAVEGYVSTLNQAGIVAVLDLHWSAPGSQPATGQQVMADADHSPAFWSSVAATFRSDPGVVFDLYNEPHDVSWSCWLNGCTTSGGWQAAGMQSLLDAVRGAGATQPVLAGGLNWGGDLSGWLANEPDDPAHQLAASAHIYNFSACNTADCWSRTIAPVGAVVPVVTGELGENDCASGFVTSYMDWADAHDVSYLGWTWDTWGCANGPSLISSYDGTPNAFGAGFQAHLAALTCRAAPPAAYVLDGYGGLDATSLVAGATAPAATVSDSWPGWDIARGAALLPGGAGGYVVDGWGGLHPFAIGSAPVPPPATGGAYWPYQDVARGVVVLPGGTGGYVLDGSGALHPFAVGSDPMPPAATASAVWPGQDIARGVVLLPGGTGGYVLDGYGRLHPFAVGTAALPPAAAVSDSWPGWDIARAVAMRPDGSGGYTLDGWGGVHPFAVGTGPMPAPATVSGYWPYRDVARALALLPSGNGGYTLGPGGSVAPFSIGGGAPATPAAVSLPAGSNAHALLLAGCP